MFPKIKGNKYQYRILGFPSYNVLYTSSITKWSLGTVYYVPPPGWYIFEARMINDCGTSQWIGFEVYYQDCGSGGNGGEGRFTVSPNPTFSEINVVSRNTASETTRQNNNITQLKLYDFVGNVLLEKKNGNLNNLNLASMKAGMYYLEITSNENKEIHRIIIEK